MPELPRWEGLHVEGYCRLCDMIRKEGRNEVNPHLPDLYPPSGFGQYLKAARRVAGHSERDLADAVGLSTAHLIDMEAGKRAAPSDDMIDAIAEWLDVPADPLYHYAGRVPPDLRDAPAAVERVIQAYAVLRLVLLHGANISMVSSKDQNRDQTHVPTPIPTPT